ncbi:MAG: hypothetical protein ABUS79_02350 [Pseudomonadota bacterium]
MAKPFRSPLVGYNHNLSHLGRVFHVQTEDSGPATPRLFTHLFFEGTILVSRKCEYDAALADEKVRAVMQAQHKAVIKDLLHSRLDDRIVAFFASRGEDLMPVVQARAAAAAARAEGMPGAVPQATLRETPEPVMVLTDMPGATSAAPLEAVALAPAAVTPPAAPARVDPEALPDAVDGVPAAAPRRRTASYQRGTSSGPHLDLAVTASPSPSPPPSPSPSPSVVPVARAPESSRPPFVRSGAPAAATRVSSASAEGVVVQRSVVIGGAGSSPSRPARIRPPIPYVVTGGGHTERPRQPVPSPLSPLSAATGRPVSGPAAPPPAASPPLSAVEAPLRATGAFGVPLGDDKSLDEVILEYLSEDSD